MGGDDARFTCDAPAGASALVVVGGWHGARDKNVKKYTEEFNAWGVATLRTTMPGHLTFSPVNAGRRQYTRDLLIATWKARQTHGLTDKPLYLMFMSNGGCWLWASMQADGMLDGEFADLGRACAGIIFDSSPAFMTFANGAKVLGLGMNPVARVAVTGTFFAAAAAMGAYSLLTTGSLDATPPKMFWRAVRNAKSYGAELYLFSDSDPLCDANKVQALLTERRDSGTIHAKVSFKRWKESRHCAHLVDQRDEYVAELRQFLRLK
jgi:hypothetical protein|tara:strand:- start:1083 stop:1877 length:795 start_codon:yes stop_codon:yes gene_type:complete|mmetsp:Transcript_4266/g.14212  ORF Transcript_4266/g.14212 Transcript_4266/m.14212 type:complete len:265 (+) Transcript_4266:24-818(+)